MTTSAVTPQIQGLPPGAIVGPPLGASPGQVKGLPPGAIVGPTLSSRQPATPQPEQTSPEEAEAQTMGGEAPPAAQASAGQAFQQGGKEGLQDIWGAVKGLVSGGGPGVQGAKDVYEHIKEAIPAFHAYEAARTQGKGIIDSLSAANDEMAKQQAARDVLQQRIDEFKKAPGAASVRAIVDASAMAASLYAGGPKAAGETEAVVPAEESAATEAAPAEATAGPTVSAKEARVQKSVSKAGLEEGESAKAAVPAKTTITPAQTQTTPGTEPSQPPQGTMHEPILQNSVRTQVNKLAAKEGLEPVPDTTDLRDVGKNLSDQFYARSKAGFAQIKEATGVDVNVLRDQISDLYAKKAETFNDPEKEGAIIEKINGLESEAEQAFADAKKAGVDTDKPLSDWKKFKAASDYGEQVRASTNPHEKEGTFDPGKYTPRLEKLYRSNPKYPNQPGRLEQLFGKEGSEAMRDDAYAADQTQQALKNFKPEPGTPAQTTKIPATKTVTPAQPAQPATESKALYDLVRKNTGRRFGVADERTNWVKTYQDFDKLSPADRAARFKNPAAVEQVLLKQARNQRLRVIGTGVGLGALAHEFGVDNAVLRTIGAAAQ